MPTSHILIARLIAAALNVAPPIVGSYALGRESYGLMASILAIATMVYGPVSLYLSQNLLRVLSTAQQAERPLGATMLFCAGCIALIAAAHFAGWVPASEGWQLGIIVVCLTLLRICEVQLISSERIVTAIVVFFALPPLLCSVFYVIAGALGGGDAAAATAQTLAYCVAALIAMYSAKGMGALLLQALRTPVGPVAREFARSLPLMFSSGALTVAEFLPVVLLRSLDAFSVIPVYEVARKIASVPTTLANPILNQINPSIFRAHASRDHLQVQVLLGKIFKFLAFTGMVFAGFVVATLIAGHYLPRVQDVANLLVPLALGATVAMWCVPYQALLIAARGDRWFTISSTVSVALLVAVTHLFSALGPGLAVSCAVGISVAASGLIVRHRALKMA